VNRDVGARPPSPHPRSHLRQFVVVAHRGPRGASRPARGRRRRSPRCGSRGRRRRSRSRSPDPGSPRREGDVVLTGGPEDLPDLVDHAAGFERWMAASARVGRRRHRFVRIRHELNLGRRSSPRERPEHLQPGRGESPEEKWSPPPPPSPPPSQTFLHRLRTASGAPSRPSRSPPERRKPALGAGSRDGRYWARTSDPQLVEEDQEQTRRPEMKRNARSWGLPGSAAAPAVAVESTPDVR
jgi:hypothetical protein